MILRAKVHIIRMRKVPFIDSTGLHNLSVMCEQSEEQGIQVVLSGVLPAVEIVLLKAKFDERLGRENICSHINLALERAKEIVSTTTKKLQNPSFSIFFSGWKKRSIKRTSSVTISAVAFIS